MNSRSDMPPIWRIRKIGSKWCVLRIMPIRHTLYFPVKNTDSFAEALLWLCQRTGSCDPLDTDGTRDDFPRV